MGTLCLGQSPISVLENVVLAWENSVDLQPVFRKLQRRSSILQFRRIKITSSPFVLIFFIEIRNVGGKILR